MAKKFLEGVTIYQKGGTGQGGHDELKAAAEFYLAELLSTRMVNTLCVRVELQARVPNDRNGDHTNGAGGSQQSKYHTVRIQRENPFSSQLRTLAHECVHVAQRAMNRLQKRRWKSDGQLHVRWEGVECGVFDPDDYMTPWECEARRTSEHLYSAWSNRNKTCVCKLCKETNTVYMQVCRRCWELDQRVRENPQGAATILQELGKQTEPFKLSDERLQAIVDDCDDTAGMLVKESTLRYFIEKAVNDDRKGR